MHLDCESGSFVWDIRKEALNVQRHGISFAQAAHAFADSRRLLLKDARHSGNEQRYYCIGRIGRKVATVRFTYREGRIRIFGAGYWRKWRNYYEKENSFR